MITIEQFDNGTIHYHGTFPSSPPPSILPSCMKRVTSVLLAVLLGALATGAGMGVFLKLANDDRARLANDVSRAKAATERADREKQQIADEANKKVAAANAEVTKAQRILQAVVQERELMAKAKSLAKPPARELRGWQPVVSLQQGVRLNLPPGTAVEANDERSLTAVLRTAATGTAVADGFLEDARWFSITPYDERLETELISALATGTESAYVVNGRLLLGRTIRPNDSRRQMTVLRVEQAASSTHLIWIKDPGTLGWGNGIERLLGTLEFRS